MIFDEVAKTIRWGKKLSPINGAGENWIHMCKGTLNLPGQSTMCNMVKGLNEQGSSCSLPG